MRRLLRLIAVILPLLALLTAIPAPAQELPSAGGKPTHIKAELIAETARVAPGGTVWLAIRMTPEPGWHGYWLNPGDAGLGITLSFGESAAALPFELGELRYPVPDTLLVQGLMNHVYKGEYVVLLPLKAETGASGRHLLRLAARWLACTDKVCVPEDAELELPGYLEIASAGSAALPGDPRFDTWRAALPAPLGASASFAVEGGKVRVAVPLPAGVALDNPHLFVADENIVDYAAPQLFRRDGDMLVIELTRAPIDPAMPTRIGAVLRLNRAGDGVSIAAGPGPIPTGGTLLTPAGEDPALPWLLLSALLGGLLLNVMPCVFPILSLKALSLARAGESEAQARAEGLAYSAGVVLACLALGGLLLALRAGGEQVGWAFQLQEPLVVAGLLLLAVTITANLAGLFEFTVPGFASEGSPRGGTLGAFATGLLAAFVATPCTGPFMAAAMGAALLLPVDQALALFAMLGLGLALPFLALAFVPALRRRLPKPGAWMRRFKLAMTVPMGLTALALVWLASRVGGDGFALAAGLLVLILLSVLVMLGRRQRNGLAGGLPVWGALAVVTAAFALGLPGTVREGGAAEAGLLGAKPFSEAELAKARATGKPVFAYFTADWCVTCKVNERAAIERSDTKAAFDKAGVVVLRGDWTRRDPAITRYLTAQGAAGVPLYMWYPAGGGPGRQLPQVLTPAMLAELASGK
jgi:DsbC/DsbD-like thiol-disulfide interchange protein/cytochrome c biogenesis protein CcdA